MKTKLIKLFLIITTTFIVAACGTGKVMVKKPIENARPIAGVIIKPDQSLVSVNHKSLEVFEKRLNNKLYESKEGAYKKTDDLIVQYRFIQMQEGSQMGRWLTGGIGNIGESNMTVEIRLFDKNKKQLGKFLTEGKISSGFFGGSLDSALERSADEAAYYIRSQFPPKRS